MSPVGFRIPPSLTQASRTGSLTRFKGWDKDDDDLGLGDSSDKWAKGGGPSRLPSNGPFGDEGGGLDSFDSLGPFGKGDSFYQFDSGEWDSLGPDDSGKFGKRGPGDSGFKWRVPISSLGLGPSDSPSDWPGLEIPSEDFPSVNSALIGLGPKPGDIVFDTEKRHVYAFTPSTGRSEYYISSRNEEVQGGLDASERYGPQSSMTYFLDQKSADIVQALLTVAKLGDGQVAAMAKQALREKLCGSLRKSHAQNSIGITTFSLSVGARNTLNVNNRPRVGLVPLEIIGEGDSAEIKLGDRITDIYGTLQPKK